MNERQSTPRVPVCDLAREIKSFKLRLKHYRICADPRCRARADAARNMAVQVAKTMKEQRDKARGSM